MFSDFYANEWFMLAQILSSYSIYRTAVTSPVKVLAGKARLQTDTISPLIYNVRLTALYGENIGYNVFFVI